MNFKGTIKQLAERYKVKPEQMAGAIHFLIALDIAKEVDEIKPPKGRAAKVYEVDESRSIASGILFN